MGKETDAVVDPRLRVYGVAGLRVADASIMPAIIARQHQRAVDHDRRESAAMILEDARAA